VQAEVNLGAEVHMNGEGEHDNTGLASHERTFANPLALTDYRGEERETILRACFVERLRILPDQLQAIDMMKQQGADQRALLNTLDRLIRLRYDVSTDLVPWSGVPILYRLETFPPSDTK
jgi:hypothetical protein